MNINRRLLFISIFLAIAPMSEVQAVSQACANLSAASFSSLVVPSGQTSFASGSFTSGDYLTISVTGVLDSSMWSLVDGGGNILTGPYTVPVQLNFPITGSISGIGVKSVGGNAVQIASAACAAATPVKLIGFDVK